MPFSVINVGAAPDDGTGDPGRDAFIKVNGNFALTQTTLDTLQTLASGKPPVDSPAFTGVPTVPTAPGGTSTTQIASTAFVATELGSYYTQTQVNANFAPLASPTFTGTVTVPTPADADDSTKATNTAWVLDRLATYIPSLPNGTAIGSAYAEYTANANLTTTIPLDDTIPQNTEGTQVLSTAYAASSTTNRLRVRFTAQVNASAASHVIAALFIDSAADAVRASDTYVDAVGNSRFIVVEYEYVPGTTSSRTYAIRVGPFSAVTVRLNGATSGRWFGGASSATLTITEIKA